MKVEIDLERLIELAVGKLAPPVVDRVVKLHAQQCSRRWWRGLVIGVVSSGAAAAILTRLL